MRRIVEVGHDQRWRCWFPRISTTILKYSFSIESGWEFIKENKKLRKQEKTLSTKKAIKKKEKNDKVQKKEKKKENTLSTKKVIKKKRKKR